MFQCVFDSFFNFIGELTCLLDVIDLSKEVLRMLDELLHYAHDYVRVLLFMEKLATRCSDQSSMARWTTPFAAKSLI